MTDAKKSAREKFFPQYWERGGLEYAIDNGDLPEIVRCLRSRSSPLPKKFVHKLADYLDPDRPPMRSGPKGGSPHTLTRTVNERIMRRYLTLCECPDKAWEALGKEAFQRVYEEIKLKNGKTGLVTTKEIVDNALEFLEECIQARKSALQLVPKPAETANDGEISPLLLNFHHRESEWKYPHRERDRKAQKPAKRGEIKDMLCEINGIGGRTFDAMLACYKKMIVERYLEHMKFEKSPDKAKQRICNRYGLLPESFDKILAKRKI